MPIQNTARASQLANEAADCCRRITELAARPAAETGNAQQIRDLAAKAKGCCEQINQMARS